MQHPSHLDLMIPEGEVRRRVESMAQEIRADYEGKEMTTVGVLKGAFMFTADLVRKINLPMTCEFLRVASYKHNKSTGSVKVEFDISESVEGKHVLLVEDIIDTGRTMKFLIEHLKAKRPASVKVCTLLYKEVNAGIRKSIDYVGFDIPPEYVVGYGMDDLGLWRHLPAVYFVKKKT